MILKLVTEGYVGCRARDRNVTLAHTNADTLASMKMKEEKLKKLLQGASVKGFGELNPSLLLMIYE